jgi:hypothetical protein
LIVEDPGTGQDAIAKERDWRAPVETPLAARSSRESDAAGNQSSY